MLEVISAKYLGDYSIEAVFNNGVVKVIDLKSQLTGEVFKPLKDKKIFQRFSIQLNTIAWENGADFAPEFLYKIGKEATGKKVA